MSIWRCVSADPASQGEYTPPSLNSSQSTTAVSPPVGSLPRRFPPAPLKEVADPTADLELPPMKWWDERITQQVLERQRWVSFDLETVLLDTLANSPRILSVSFQTSSTFQRVIQQDAAFDSTVLLSSNLGATNDPVGNTLTTGGAPRLRENSLNFRGGAKKTTRQGTELEWTQEIGFLDSNSSFFVPRDQGNARLSLGLTKPLLSRGGRYYNERLVTQAQIESRVAWQDMRGAVEQRIADVIAAYWKLYEIRAQLTQQRELLARSQYLERVLVSRKDFDAALIEITKAKQRVARRGDQLIDLEAELLKQQARLAALVGSDAMIGVENDLELIPIARPVIVDTQWALRDAVSQALENRPEVRAATHDVELSALELQVTRVELEPQLNWVFNGYLSQLNGGSKIAKSFGQQFENAPGISTGIEFEVPRGRRAFRAQHREALLKAKQRNERLREVIQQTQFDVETALIDLSRFQKQLTSKRNVLASAITEENILTVQWRIIGGDDSRVGIMLENLLDAQQRRTDAEKDLVAVEAAYMIAQVQLQRAMGTLLINEGIRPQQIHCSGEIDFVRDEYQADASESIIHHEPIQSQQELTSPLTETGAPNPARDWPSYAETAPATNPQPSFELPSQDVVPQDAVPPDTVKSNTVQTNAPVRLPPIANRVLVEGNVGNGRADHREPSQWSGSSARLQMPSYVEPNITENPLQAERPTWQTPAQGWTR
ncbi:MAG: TolC family protein [Planctomycetales bacterium]|nr:TolC family protein [Planctomycetales bacterium]